MREIFETALPNYIRFMIIIAAKEEEDEGTGKE